MACEAWSDALAGGGSLWTRVARHCEGTADDRHFLERDTMPEDVENKTQVVVIHAVHGTWPLGIRKQRKWEKVEHLEIFIRGR